ncbi:efflux transporter outer membrane subunit [Salegentibacter sp. F14]
MKSLRTYSLLIAGIIPFLLVSCFAAKEYKRPEIQELDENLYRRNAIPKDSLNMAEIPWKEVFTDPQLKNYIAEGLENNIDIRRAIQQLLMAEAYVKQGRAGHFPTLNIGGNVNHQILSKNSQFGSFFNGSITQYDVTGNLSWEADIWGKIRSNERALQASYLQSSAAHKAVQTRLIANIASTYYRLLSLDAQKEITLETIVNRERSLETTKALKEAGNLTAVGVKQTQAQLHTAQALLIDINNQIRLLENSFSILLGEGPQAIERGRLENQKINTELNTGVPAQLLRNRPDILTAEYNLVNAFELTNVARSNFYPSLSFSAAGGFQSLELDELFNANSLFANLASSLMQPVLNGRKIRTQFEVAQAQQEDALLHFKQAILNAGKEVSDALYNYEASNEKIKVLKEQYKAYADASEYSEELLNNGLANYLEVLTARENALSSQLNLISTEFSKLQAMVDLYRALGGGWQ